MPHFDYPCPDCRATTSLHDADCRFEGTPWVEVERAYVDIVSVLAGGPCDEETLRREAPGEWGPLQQAALRRLKRDERVSEANSGVLRLLTAEEFREEVSEPTREPMRTLHQYGSVPGCHDNAVFAMIAWYEMVGLSWPETRENVVNWLRDTGTWDRGGFEEATPAELVEKKRHVYDAGYGWKEKAVSAKRVIDRYRS
ncbi:MULTISPECIES: DUF7474 family protein [Haloferax]|uniref:Uncharacterized protein n=1 Tax=Haloferax denitrificans ATCC 35960 TaxID=662478 RepID=M0JDW7_9EURY|nr:MULTISPECIES: hypothetical protein [Haloferax]EMA05880.1 hypothetical protein C438_08632 [Haloferax denitrificans ATCC 35960]